MLIVRRAQSSLASHTWLSAEDVTAMVQCPEHGVTKTVLICSWWTAQSRAAPSTPDGASMATLSSA